MSAKRRSFKQATLNRIKKEFPKKISQTNKTCHRLLDSELIDDPDRICIAVLDLAKGKYSEVLTLVGDALIDCRDVLLWQEGERYFQTQMKKHGYFITQHMEVIKYIEPDNLIIEFKFDLNQEPPLVTFPSLASWESRVPTWAAKNRKIILQRIKKAADELQWQRNQQVVSFKIEED